MKGQAEFVVALVAPVMSESAAKTGTAVSKS
jgi:hypothetical protein